MKHWYPLTEDDVKGGGMTSILELAAKYFSCIVPGMLILMLSGTFPCSYFVEETEKTKVCFQSQRSR